MRFSTSLPEKKIMGFSIVNYSLQAVFGVFFISVINAGILVMLVTNVFHFSLASGLLTWSGLTVALFVIMMRYRDRCVRLEMDEGIHDPLHQPIRTVKGSGSKS